MSAAAAPAFSVVVVVVVVVFFSSLSLSSIFFSKTLLAAPLRCRSFPCLPSGTEKPEQSTPFAGLKCDCTATCHRHPDSPYFIVITALLVSLPCHSSPVILVTTSLTSPSVRPPLHLSSSPPIQIQQLIPRCLTHANHNDARLQSTCDCYPPTHCSQVVAIRSRLLRRPPSVKIASTRFEKADDRRLFFIAFLRMKRRKQKNKNRSAAKTKKKKKRKKRRRSDATRQPKNGLQNVVG